MANHGFFRCQLFLQFSRPNAFVENLFYVRWIIFFATRKEISRSLGLHTFQDFFFRNIYSILNFRLIIGRNSSYSIKSLFLISSGVLLNTRLIAGFHFGTIFVFCVIRESS
eukprot:NODE_226_length_12301_cov_1.446648.p10 type:complete len:111 gc:universal NODE_226_length_12301_cov_1.446648:8247-7915(-)